MSRNRLLLIINRWKNEAYELSQQLEYIKNDYQQENCRLKQKLNEFELYNISLKNSINSPSITNEDILKQLLINVDKTSIHHQISVLCDFFVNSLKELLLSKIILEKEQSTIKFPLIIENIETNIKQIGNLINRMNEDCSNQLIKNINMNSLKKY